MLKMTSLLLFIQIFISGFAIAENEVECRELLLEKLKYGELIIEETAANDNKPLELKFTELKISEIDDKISMSVLGTKDGKIGAFGLDGSEKKIKKCKVDESGRIEFKVKSVKITEKETGLFKASAFTWKSYFQVIN